jgi:hypothetical protein
MSVSFVITMQLPVSIDKFKGYKWPAYFGEVILMTDGS